jgi:hypothetical protein
MKLLFSLPPTVHRIATLGDLTPQLHLRDHRCCQILQQSDVPIGPKARSFVNDAQGTNGVALAGDDRNSGVGDPPKLPNDRIVSEQRMAAGVLQYQRLPRRNDLSAEGKGNRGNSP